jgi:hypothetical protein
MCQSNTSLVIAVKNAKENVSMASVLFSKKYPRPTCFSKVRGLAEK